MRNMSNGGLPLQLAAELQKQFPNLTSLVQRENFAVLIEQFAAKHGFTEQQKAQIETYSALSKQNAEILTFYFTQQAKLTDQQLFDELVPQVFTYQSFKKQLLTSPRFSQQEESAYL